MCILKIVNFQFLLIRKDCLINHIIVLFSINLRLLSVCEDHRNAIIREWGWYAFELYFLISVLLIFCSYRTHIKWFNEYSCIYHWLMKIEHHQYLWCLYDSSPSHLFRHSFYSEFWVYSVLAFICSLIVYLHRQNINILKICINGVILYAIICALLFIPQDYSPELHACYCMAIIHSFWCCMMFRWMSIQDLSNLYTYILLIYLGYFLFCLLFKVLWIFLYILW